MHVPYSLIVDKYKRTCADVSTSYVSHSQSFQKLVDFTVFEEPQNFSLKILSQIRQLVILCKPDSLTVAITIYVHFVKVH